MLLVFSLILAQVENASSNCIQCDVHVCSRPGTSFNSNNSELHERSNSWLEVVMKSQEYKITLRYESSMHGTQYINLFLIHFYFLVVMYKNYLILLAYKYYLLTRSKLCLWWFVELAKNEDSGATKMCL